MKYVYAAFHSVCVCGMCILGFWFVGYNIHLYKYPPPTLNPPPIAHCSGYLDKL